MGILDKVKVGVKNVDSKLGEEYDEVGFKKKIHDQKSAIESKYKTIGEKYYKGADKAELKKLCDEIKDCEDKIAQLEADLADMKKKGKEERENNRKAA